MTKTKILANITFKEIDNINKSNYPAPKVEAKPEEVKNPIKGIFDNLKNTKKNFNIIRASPYASLKLSIKVRKWIIGLLSVYLIWMGFNMIKNYQATGFMGTFGKVVMAGLFAYIIYMLYKTIPQAQKQLEYYQKYPHLINYCPTNVKQDIDDIFSTIQKNKEVKNGKT
jgi:hypothetical protein